MRRWPSGLRWWFLAPWMLLLACMLLSGGCTCGPGAVAPERERIACVPQHPVRSTVVPAAPAVETMPAGGLAGVFSITSTGEASYTVPLAVPPGRAGMEPHLALQYRSDGGDGVLGQGFSISGVSSITRCARHLVPDGEIRAVGYDASDRLCLDGQPLVVVGDGPGFVEYRTLPDTFVRVKFLDINGDGLPDAVESGFQDGALRSYLNMGVGFRTGAGLQAGPVNSLGWTPVLPAVHWGCSRPGPARLHGL